MTTPNAVPVERLLALLALLYPDEITPIAHRMFSKLIEEYAA